MGVLIRTFAVTVNGEQWSVSAMLPTDLPSLPEADRERVRDTCIAKAVMKDARARWGEGALTGVYPVYEWKARVK